MPKTKKKLNSKKRWIVYCLCSTNPRKPNHTYVGMTNNFKHRHRQHNQEIKGGARYTRMHGPWKTLFKIRGLKSKSDAMSLESALKKMRKGPSGSKGRFQTLNFVLGLTRWVGRSFFLNFYCSKSAVCAHSHLKNYKKKKFKKK